MVDKTYSASSTLINLFDGQIILRDTISSSSTETRTNVVSVETYNIYDSAGVECFFSESQVITPSLGDSRFTTSLSPTTALATGVGPKTVYLWCKKDSNLQRSYNSIFLADASPCDTRSEAVVPKVLYGFEEGTVSTTMSGSRQPLSRIESAISDTGEILTVWQDQSNGNIIGRIDNSDFAKILGPTVLLTSTGPVAGTSYNAAITGIDLAADFNTGGWVLVYTRNLGSVSADIYYVRIAPDLTVGPEISVGNGAYPRIDCAENGTVAVAFRQSTYQMSGSVKLTAFDSSNATVFITTVLDPSGTLVNAATAVGEHDLVVDKVSGTITVAHTSRPAVLRVTRYTSVGALETPNGTIDIGAFSFLPPNANTLNLANQYDTKEFTIAWQRSSSLQFTAYTTTGVQKYSPVSIAAPSSGRARAAILSSPATTSINPRLIIKSDAYTGSTESLNFYVYDNSTPPNLIRGVINDHVGVNTDGSTYEGYSPLTAIDDQRFVFSVPITTLATNKISQIIAKQYDIDINALVDNEYFLSTRTARYLALDPNIFANFTCPIVNESYLLSETQITIPATSHPGFTAAVGTVTLASFLLATNSGIHTVYLWTKTTIVNPLVSFATIFLGVDNQIVLRDRISGSTSRTESAVVSVETYDVHGVIDFECFFSTSQAITPSLSDTRFTTSLSLTLDLGSPSGVITAYLWSKKDSFLRRTNNSIFYDETPSCETAFLHQTLKENDDIAEGSIIYRMNQNAAEASTNGNVLYVWQDESNGDILGRIDNEGFAKEKGPKVLVSGANFAPLTGGSPSNGSTFIDIASDIFNDGWVIAFSRGTSAYYVRIDGDLNVGSEILIASGCAPKIDADENGNVSVIYRGPDALVSYAVTLRSFDSSNSPLFAATTVPDPTSGTIGSGSTIGLHDIFVEKQSGDITTVHNSRRPDFRVSRLTSAGSFKTTVPTLDVSQFFGTASYRANTFNLAHRYGSNDVAVIWGHTSSSQVRIAAVDSTGSLKYSVSSPFLFTGGFANIKARIFYTSPPDTYAIDPKLVLMADTGSPNKNSFYIYENDSVPTLRETVHSGGGVGLAGYFGPPAVAAIDDEKIRFASPAGPSSVDVTRIVNKELNLGINSIEKNRFYLVDGINTSITKNINIRAVFECPILNQEYLLSETQTTIPTTSHPGFTSAIGTVSFANFTLTAAFGVHTVYLWTKTGTIAVDDITTSSNIFLGIDGQIILRDRFSDSSSYTESSIVSVETYEINGISGIECFFSETQVITPSLGDSRFTTSLMPTVAVSDFHGRKTVYLWCKAGSYLSNSHNNIFYSPTGNCASRDTAQINKFRDFAEEGTTSNNIHTLVSATSVDGSVLTVWADSTTIYGRIDSEDFAKTKGPKALISDASFSSGGPGGPLGTAGIAPDLNTGGWVIAYCKDAYPTLSIYYARIDLDLNVVSETIAFPSGVLSSGETPKVDTDQSGNVILTCRQSISPKNVQLTSYSITNSLRFLITTVPSSAGSVAAANLQDIAVDKESGEIWLMYSRAVTTALRLAKYTSTGTLSSTTDVSESILPIADSLWLANRFGSKEFVASWKSSASIKFVAFDEFGVQKYPVQSFLSTSVKNSVIVTGPANTYSVNPRIIIREARSASDTIAINSFYVYENDSVPTLFATINEPTDSNDGISALTYAPPALSAINDNVFRYSSTHSVPGGGGTRYVSLKEIDLTIDSIVDRQFYLSYGRSRLYSNSINVLSNFECPIGITEDYLLSETQTTVPTTTHPGFVSVVSTLSFTNFVLSTFVGLHTVYLWTKTGTQAIDSVISLSTIFLTPLGFERPYETEIVLHDRITDSYEETNSEIVSIDVYELNNNLGDLLFFVSESQTTAPTTSDVRFVSTAPLTFAVATGLGIRTLYLWHKEPSDEIVGSQNSIFLNPSIDCAATESYFITKEQDNFDEDTIIGSAKGLCMSTSVSHRVLSVWLDEEMNDIVGRVDGPDFAKEVGPKVLVSNVSTWQTFPVYVSNYSASSWIDVCEDLSTGGWVLTYTITDYVYYRRFGQNLEDLSGTDNLVHRGITPRVGVDESGNVVVVSRIQYPTTGGAPPGYVVTHHVQFRKFDASDTETVPTTIVTAITTSGIDTNPPRDPEILVHKQSGNFVIAQAYHSLLGFVYRPAFQINRYTSSGVPEGTNPVTTFISATAGGALITLVQNLHLAGRYGSDEFVVGWADGATFGQNCFFRVYHSDGSLKTPSTVIGSSILRQTNMCIASPVNTSSADSKIVFRGASGSVGFGASNTFIFENSSPATHLVTIPDDNGTASGVSFNNGRLALTSLGSDKIRYMVPFFEDSDISRIKSKEINLLSTSLNSGIVLADQTNSSTVTTDARLINVEFDCPVWDASYLLSESQTTAPVSTDPSFIAGTALSETSFNLYYARGLHTVYAWYKNSGIVNPSVFFATIALVPDIVSINYSSSVDVQITLDSEYSGSGYLVNSVGPMTEEIEYSSSANIIGSVTEDYSSSADLQATTSLFYSGSAELVDETLTWTYALKPGNNMVSAALSTSLGLTAKDFVSNSSADFFFYENSGNLSLQFGNFIHSNPSNPSINIPIDPGVGYIVVLNSSFAGLVRTISIIGTPWND